MDHVSSLAARQFGLIQRDQTRAAGMSADVIFRRVASGRWHELYPGVYALPGAPRSWRQKVLGAILWAGKGSAASFGSAGALYGFPGFDEGVVEISSSRNLRIPSKALVFHRAKLPPKALAKITIIPVTTPIRTFLDLAAGTDFEALQEVVDYAYGKRLVSYGRLASALEDAKGRHGISKLREIVADAAPTPESVLERRFLRRLDAAGFLLPIRQFRVWDGGTLLARVDFAYPDLMVAIEADGFEFHSGRRVFDSDREKWNRLAARGWRILYVTWTDLQRGCPSVLAAIKTYVPRTALSAVSRT